MLEMFERLLAALIILALLVLVMFIALPYPAGGDRTVTAPVDQRPQVEPSVAPADSETAKSPDVGGADKAAENRAAPPPSEKPEVGAPNVRVPNPPGSKAADGESKAPPITDKIARDNPGGIETKPKQKFVKTHPDRLPASAEVEPVATTRVDKPAAAEKPKLGKPKSDRLKIDRSRTETAFRSPAARPLQRYVVVGDDRGRDDGIGDYIRRTDSGPADWRRTHYYECTDGRCECACDRPYWANSGPPCFD